MWSVCALSIGKARAAVPAFAVVAGGQLARLAAVVLAVVLTLPAVAVSVAAGGVMGGGWCYTLAAFLGARWRPVCGPCGGVAGNGLSVPLAWPLRAARGWRWRGLDMLRVVLAAVAVWTAPAAAVAVAGAYIKRARRRGPFAGLAALRWWRGQIVKERARLALLALSRCCGGRGGSRTRAAVGGPPMVTAVALAGRCG